MPEFLPVCRADLQKRGWDQLDFIFISGDAYIDHPSFGCAILTRLLEKQGYRVGVIAQPQDDRDFQRLGTPRLAFLVGSGNVDSMVAHYTVAKRRRNTDSYSPGGKTGQRPDRATVVYCQTLRRLFGSVPLVIGGIEASLRRFAHYDYWTDSVHPSILEDSGADILIYGMGESQLTEIARRLSEGEPIGRIRDVRGCCVLVPPRETPLGCKECPSFAQVLDSKKAYAKACRIQQEEQDEVTGRTLIQRQNRGMLVQNPPMPVLTTEEFDAIYELPYARRWHPCYDKEGGVPALAEVEFSITHNRGCFGGCNFCAISLHQGRRITVRSEQSILKEAELMTRQPNFKGYIHDVGGPTANFRHPSCEKQLKKGLCRGRSCLAPQRCPNLNADHSEYVGLLRRLRALPGVKRVFIRSGIRYDYLMADEDPTFLRELVCHHVSGQLRVAPEHCVDRVLDCMGKPHVKMYTEFMQRFAQETRRAGKEQYLVPYLMSSHPGSRMQEAVQLAEYLHQYHIRPEQVQDFYPTPGTVSTCMFYTGLDPMTMQPVYVPHAPREKKMQRALLQYFIPENAPLVRQALRQAGRTDLIGIGRQCLVPPDTSEKIKTERRKQKGWREGAKRKAKRR